MIFIVYQNVRVISTCRPLHCMHMIICVNWNRGRTLCWLKMDDPPCAWRHSVHKASVWHKHLVQKNEEKKNAPFNWKLHRREKKLYTRVCLCFTKQCHFKSTKISKETRKGKWYYRKTPTHKWSSQCVFIMLVLVTVYYWNNKKVVIVSGHFLLNVKMWCTDEVRTSETLLYNSSMLKYNF